MSLMQQEAFCQMPYSSEQIQHAELQKVCGRRRILWLVLFRLSQDGGLLSSYLHFQVKIEGKEDFSEEHKDNLRK